MGQDQFNNSFEAMRAQRRHDEMHRALYEQHRAAAAEAERRKGKLQGDDIVDAEFEVIEPLRITKQTA